MSGGLEARLTFVGAAEIAERVASRVHTIESFIDCWCWWCIDAYFCCGTAWFASVLSLFWYEYYEQIQAEASVCSKIDEQLEHDERRYEFHYEFQVFHSILVYVVCCHGPICQGIPVLLYSPLSPRNDDHKITSFALYGESPSITIKTGGHHKPNQSNLLWTKLRPLNYYTLVSLDLFEPGRENHNHCFWEYLQYTQCLIASFAALSDENATALLIFC